MEYRLKGSVPQENFEYYIVTKRYVAEKDRFGFGKYDVEDKLIIDKKDLNSDCRPKEYKDKHREFLRDCCRNATKEEADEMYKEMYDNAVIHSEGLIDYTYFYYIPNFNLDLLTSKDKRHLHTYEGLSFNKIDGKQFVSKESIKLDSIIKVEKCKYDNLRKATKEEAIRCCQELCRKMNEAIERSNREAEEYRRKLEEQYRLYRNDPAYFPGSCGNFKQVLTGSDFKPKGEKLYDLYTIKKFYEELIASGKISKDMLERIFLYGGTVPYLLAGASEAPRKFGDIDIFIPIQNMDSFRNALKNKSYFKMKYDSKILTEKSGLTPSIDIYEIKGYKYREVFQDFGFKGELFGVNISVFPIYQWNKRGALDICSKSFRVGTGREENKFLLNTVITHNTNIGSFSKLVELCGGTIGTIPLEYTIASKKSAIENGFKKREDKDMVDLDFIESNKSRLNIDDSLVEHFQKNIPDNGIALVYRIKKNSEVSTMSPDSYRNFVTQNRNYPS